MKTVNLYAKAGNRSLALCLGGALLCLAAQAQAQNDPSGTWDFVVSGSWNFDSKGRTIGFINEGEDSPDVAASSSFVATVKPGKRMTMKLTDSPNPTVLDFKPRNRVYKGIPLEPTDD